jgi:hypothetical protein
MKKTKTYIFNTWYFILILVPLFFCFVSPVYAMDVSFQWDSNSETDIAGYKVFCREEDQSYNYTNPSWEGLDTMCTIYDLDENKNYYFVLRCFDINGFESSDSNELYLEAAIIPYNQPPIAVISEDYIEANPGTTITLDASRSTDADDGIASYDWTQIDGMAVTLSGHNTETATFTTPETDIYGSNLSFKLTVTDFGGLQSTAICFVYITNDIQVDNVTITSAVYSAKPQKLTIEAVSDAPANSVILIAWANYKTESVKLGNLMYLNNKQVYHQTFKRIDKAPDSITVLSSDEGSDTVQCSIR